MMQQYKHGVAQHDSNSTAYRDEWQAAVPFSEQTEKASQEHLIREVLSESLILELEDVLDVGRCGCGDILTAARALRNENERLKRRLRQYEAELTELRHFKKMSEIRR